MAEVGEKKVEAMEGSELHENVNSEQLASDPPMIHKTIVVHEQEEDLEVSTNNMEGGNHEGEDLEVPNKLEGHHEVIPPLKKEGPAKVKTTMSFFHGKKERHIQIINILLRCIGILFSFISFVIMASDNRDDYQSYDDYGSFENFEAYRFCLAMSVLAFVYFVLQLGKGIYVTFLNPSLFRHVAFFYVDFIGDQLMAYLLMSSSSSAGSLTRALKRYGLSGRIVDLPAASLSMSFIAFVSVAASSVFSAFALAKRILW